MNIVGRKPALTPIERAYCRAMRERRLNGLAAPSTDDLAVLFQVSPATIKNAVRDLHAKHHDFIARLVRMSASLRAPAAVGATHALADKDRR